MAAILEAASAQQRALDDRATIWVLTCTLHIPASKDDFRRVSPVLQLLGHVEGEVRWVRSASGGQERLDYCFFTSARMNRDDFLDRTVIDDGQRQFTFYPRSLQALIETSAELRTFPHPFDVLRPAARASWDELTAAGMLFDARTEEDGKVTIRFCAPTFENRMIECVLDPELDFAITRWRVIGAQIECVIETVRERDGELAIPIRATMMTFSDDGGPLLSWTIERVGSPIPATTNAFQFEYPPGLLIGDYTISDRPAGYPAVFEVSATGEVVRVPANRLTAPIRSGSTGWAAMGAAVIAVGLIGARLTRLRISS